MAKRQTSNVTIRLEHDVKEKVEQLFDNLGMNLSTAFNVFVRQVLCQGKIPFKIYDPFYKEANQLELANRVADKQAGINLIENYLVEVEDEYNIAWKGMA